MAKKFIQMSYVILHNVLFQINVYKMYFYSDKFFIQPGPLVFYSITLVHLIIRIWYACPVVLMRFIRF